MDELQDWEVSLLADNLNYGLKDEWEMTRWIVCSVLRPHLKKSMAEKPMTELFPLPTDKDNKMAEVNTEISNSDIKVMRKRAGMINDVLNKKRKLDAK